jgi:alpha-acetolactate decarboxylase
MQFNSGLAALALLVCHTSIHAQTTDFRHYGDFTQMMLTGRLSGQVPLSQLDTGRNVWGVGALAELKGEIIQIDGRILVSPGGDSRGQVRAPVQGETAVLWAGGRVTNWVPINIPENMSQASLETFFQQQAERFKLDLERPWLFRVSGEYAHLIWHVVTGEPASVGSGEHAHSDHAQHGSGHANQRSGMKVFRNPSARGQLVGVYSGGKLEGVVSHRGERFHVHFVDSDMKVSGHVDQYSVRAGSTLWLPQP